jgi:hypothetical protein
MAVAERTFSSFLQHPSEIAGELSKGPVLLRRRDEEDLVVMTKVQMDALDAALRVLHAATRGGATAAKTELPWLEFLSNNDQETCIQEIARAAAGAMRSGQFNLLRDTLYAWEATGLAAWDDYNRRGDARYEGEDPVPVERPSRQTSASTARRAPAKSGAR